MSDPVFFYEREFYVLSNFSAFMLRWYGFLFYTSETAYQWSKFGMIGSVGARKVAQEILNATSAHDAFKIAERNVHLRQKDWSEVRIDVMRNILREKVRQHEYVLRKLRQTGDRQLIENSWRDDFWGWGPIHDGQNMLGKLWMEVREEFR